MRSRLVAGLLSAPLALGLAPPAHAQGERPTRPVTPAGWSVRSAGVEIGVSPLTSGFQGPLGAALSPDGTRLLSTSGGAARIQSVDLWDLSARERRDSVPYDATRGTGESAFYGVTFSPDGRRAWASGGGQPVVHAYDVTVEGLRETAQIPVPWFPAGLAYGRTPVGDRIYVANNLSGAASPLGGNPPGDRVSVIDPASGTVTKTIDLGMALQPLGVTFARDGTKAYVTNWMGRSVSVIDAASEIKTADVLLSPQEAPLQADHPSAIAANPIRDEVYTANANSDTVSVIDTRTDALIATIDVALVPGGPKGATPSGLAVSPDGATLYVAEAGENAVAVVDIGARRVRGFVPTAWYPADVEVSPDGTRLVVTNTNDSGAGPNPCGPLTPRADCPPEDPERDAPERDAPGASPSIRSTRGR